MNATEEGEDLLERYARGDEGAYAALVRRYIDLVFTAALRQSNGDVHLAEDITQTVFADLAREAPKLPPQVLLGGWLFRHTQFVASGLRRAKQRREQREMAAARLTEPETSSEAWREIAPVLDEAMNALPEADRNALILRFFEGLPLREVGAALGASEEAGRKRIDRALEKLRELLGRKGITSSTASLAVLLGGHGVVSAPAALAGVITGTAVISAGAAAAVSPVFHGLIMSKAKIGVASVLAAAAIGTPVWQYEKIKERDNEIAGLRQQLEGMAEVHSAIAALPPIEPDADELARLREQHAELMRLRGIVTLQNRDLQALRQRADSAEAEAEKEQVLRRLADLRNTRERGTTVTVIEPEYVPGEFQTAELNWAGNDTAVGAAQSWLFAVFQEHPESLATLLFYPNAPEGFEKEEEIRRAREHIARLRRDWAGVQTIKQLGFTHLRDDQYSAIFSFDYGPNGRPEGAPAGGSLALRKIGDNFRIAGYGSY